MRRYRLAVDIGGTFTDVVLQSPSGESVSVKTPTTPTDPVIGAMAGIEMILVKSSLSLDQIGTLIHGTTLATNTLIEKKGARVATIVTEGFRDILEIGYERRYNQDDLFIEKPDTLVPRNRALTLKERISAGGEILERLDSASLRAVLTELEGLDVESVAVCLLHAYVNPVHELEVLEQLTRMRPGLSVSLSSGVSAEIREFDRLSTTVANAYVKPLMDAYLTRFESSLDDLGFEGDFLMMTSAGGMTTLETARQYPVRLVESGPAGGAMLAAAVARSQSLKRAISFDMGGTTAKFCMIDSGQPHSTRKLEVARAERFIKGSGIPLRIPAVDMIEIGAGGGSEVAMDSMQRITVGPKSMGAEPGPACFDRGGTSATVTDADLVLGHIEPKYFAQGQLRVDERLADEAITRSVAEPLSVGAIESAYGIVEVVAEHMANAGRIHAGECGTDLTGRTMIAFGGNGPLHATRVARKLGVSEVVIPPSPGVGSAVGFLSAPISYECVSSHYTQLQDFDFEGVNRQLDRMSAEARAIVGDGGAELMETRTAFMRYSGQGHEIEVHLPVRNLGPQDLDGLVESYAEAYRAQFKRTVPGMRIEVMNWTVCVEQKRRETEQKTEACASRTAPVRFRKKVYFGSGGGSIDTAVYLRSELVPGHRVAGPALIVEAQTTTLVEADFRAQVASDGSLVLTRRSNRNPKRGHVEDNANIDAQLMWDRLLAVVEEQGQALIRSAFSPIVRECGDISAGIFDRSGRMLAQAVTGTPGHINTMAGSVTNFLTAFAVSQMKPGDIYVTNDPWLAAGHLNDFMLVQPVFRGGEVIGFTACTSHLVDVGGSCMGPQGKDIFDEGLIVPPVRLVSRGQVNEVLLDIIRANSRHPVENEGDLYALMACCEIGAERLQSMLDEYGCTNLDRLADYIVERSYRATVDAIRSLPNGEFCHSLNLDGYDFEIKLQTRLAITEHDIHLDFAGSSPCSSFGINVPINYAAAYSVFALRCAVARGIPNNAGSLAPFKVSAPEGSILNAIRPAPVAMRHTIGQLLPDLILGCLHQVIPLGVPAEGASCMYDLPMRSAPGAHRSFAVELVHNGGTGARPNKDGLSATAYPSGVWGSQVEITECTTPIRVRRRELRPGSGGPGRFRGGLGQVIEVESATGDDFILFLSFERMKYPASGRAGGRSGAPGKATLSSGTALPGRGEHVVPAGEVFELHTPGGGGYGNPFERDPQRVCDDVANGLLCKRQALQAYGVAIDDEGRVDGRATRHHRGLI